MDCCCICQTGKCKAHLCMERRQQITPARNCCCPNSTPEAIQVMADSNGRLLCPYKCSSSFPWGNFLKEQWIQPPCCSSKNTCGRKHIPSNTQKLPSFFKQRLTPNFKCDDDKVYIVREKGPSSQMAQVNSSRTQLLNRTFQAFKATKPPMIWIYGHPQCPIGPTRRQFGQELASKLGFQYVHFDTEILYWTDELLGRPNTEKVANLPEQHKRLATMCIQLMGDEELHLNLTGTIELFKLIVLNKTISSSMNGSESDSANPIPKGFILEGFPCTEQEASAFEKQFYPMTAGIYFQNRCWSSDKSREPDVMFPKYFRRDTPYSERKVEALVGRYGSRSIKVLNVEKFAEDEANFLMEAIEKKLGIRRNDAHMCTQTPTSVQMGCGNPYCRSRFERYENSKRMQMSGNGFNGSSTMIITCPLQTAQSQRNLLEKPKRLFRERQREREESEQRPYYSQQEIQVDAMDQSVNSACPHEYEQQRSEICSPTFGEEDVVALTAECEVVDVDVDNNFINGNCDELWTDVEVEEECPAPPKIIKPRRPRLPKKTPAKPKSEPSPKLIVKTTPRPKSTIPKQRPLTPKPKATKKLPPPSKPISLPPTPPPPKPRTNLTPPNKLPTTSLPPLPPPPSNPTTSLLAPPPPSTRRKSSIASTSSYRSAVPKTVDFAKKSPPESKKLVWDRSAIFHKDLVTLGTATNHVPSTIHDEDLPTYRKGSFHPNEIPIDPRHNLMTLPSSPLAQKTKNKKEELLYYY